MLPCATAAIIFDFAHLVRSNLGSQGGRCRTVAYDDGTVVPWQSVCDEECDRISPGGTCASPPEVKISNVGTAPSGECIDLRITNESEYRAWWTGHNGIKRVASGTIEGFFGAVNLLGPRSVTQRPFDRFWHASFTIVQLRFSFVRGGLRLDARTCTPAAGAGSDALLQIGRTFMTFCARTRQANA